MGCCLNHFAKHMGECWAEETARLREEFVYGQNVELIDFLVEERASCGSIAR